MSHPDKNSSFLYNLRPWENNSNAIWIGSTLQLSRNVDRFLFPHRLADDKKLQIVSLIAKALLNHPQFVNPQLFRSEELKLVEKEVIAEHFLFSQNFRRPSSGEGFVIDETGRALVMVNFNNHLTLEWIDTQEELENAWDALVKIESGLAKSVNFAFSPKFGFLTADPTESGTALITTVFLHLPALIHTNQLDAALNGSHGEAVELLGLQGREKELIGDIAAFRNRYTQGVTEENILTAMRAVATKLVAEEKRLRRDFKGFAEEESAPIKDKVSRAFGVLLHSYQMETEEALDAVSWVKLGLDLGWIKGASHAALNCLLFTSRLGHLSCDCKEKLGAEAILHRRAAFMHKELKGLELLI